MPSTAAGPTRDGHGPFCVSPPLGEAIRVATPTGEHYELSLNLVASGTQPGGAGTRIRTGVVQLRLVAEIAPGVLLTCLLDLHATRRLTAGLQLAALLIEPPTC
ncbi:MAG: hypothetical protein ACRDWT_09390 [Jatrophihabitantaceae bacterium]